MVLPIRLRVDLGVIVLKECSTFPKDLRLKLHHQIHFSVILRTLVDGVGGPIPLERYSQLFL